MATIHWVSGGSESKEGTGVIRWWWYEEEVEPTWFIDWRKGTHMTGLDADAFHAIHKRNYPFECGSKGGKSKTPDSTFKTILENSGICCFVWEHFQNLNHIIQWMKYCGGTFSGKKSLLCTWEITVVGHICTLEGWITDPSRVNKIVNWGPCKDLYKVQEFIGTIGVV